MNRKKREKEKEVFNVCCVHARRAAKLHLYLYGIDRLPQYFGFVFDVEIVLRFADLLYLNILLESLER